MRERDIVQAEIIAILANPSTLREENEEGNFEYEGAVGSGTRRLNVVIDERKNPPVIVTVHDA